MNGYLPIREPPADTFIGPGEILCSAAGLTLCAMQ